jgi:hypothetical protein
LPLTVEAHDELQVLNAICDNIILDPLATDKRNFVWGSAAYTPARFYRFVFISIPKEPALCSIWKSKEMPKVKVFSWLLFMEINTEDTMDRKSWNVEWGLNCVLCEEQQREPTDHLFFGCEFAKQCWDFLSTEWDLTRPILSRISHGNDRFQGPCFLEVFSCAASNVWRERNEQIVKGIVPSFDR